MESRIKCICNPQINDCREFTVTHGWNGEGNGTPLQYSCLENPTDRGAWWAAVHGVARSRTQLSDFTFTFHFHALEKEMATYSSVLAWRIPGTAEPGGLLSMGSHRVGHDWSDLAAAAWLKKVSSLAHSSWSQIGLHSFLPSSVLKLWIGVIVTDYLVQSLGHFYAV